MPRTIKIRSLAVSKMLASLVGISVLYLSLFLLVTWLTGHLQLFGNELIFFSAWSDALGYKQLADYAVSLGETERPPDYLLKHRDFLFPLYLGIYQVVGVSGMHILQITMNVFSLWMLFITLEILSGRPWLASAGTALLALTPSFTFLAFHALTETLALFLVSFFMLLIVLHFYLKESRYFPFALGVLSLLLCIRPIVLPFWTMMTAFYLLVWRRNNKVSTWQPVLIASPVLCQLLLSFLINGSPAIASVGTAAFETWFFPAVYQTHEYGQFTGRKAPQALEGLKKFPEFNDKVGYMVRNYRTTIKTYLSLLIGDHLIAGSNFVKLGTSMVEENSAVPAVVTKWSVQLSRLFLCLHVVMFGVFIMVVVRGGRMLPGPAFLVFYTFALLLILPAGLAYMQGDRYILLAEPLWLGAHGALLSRCLDALSGRAEEIPIAFSSR